MTDISKSPQKIAGMFDAIAARYDFLNHLLSAGIDKRWRKAAIRSLGLTGKERVLDLCTGTADLAIAARAATPRAARVVGVDFAGAMLRVGQDKLLQGGLADRVARVPVATASVDAVTIAFGIRNVEQTAEACAEMHRVLKPGGRLAVLEFAIPRTALVRAGYLFYFNHVLPRIGQLVARHQAYAYLPASVGAFQTPDEFVTLLRQVGFRDVQAQPLTFGIVYLYTAARG